MYCLICICVFFSVFFIFMLFAFFFIVFPLFSAYVGFDSRGFEISALDGPIGLKFLTTGFSTKIRWLFKFGVVLTTGTLLFFDYEQVDYNANPK